MQKCSLDAGGHPKIAFSCVFIDLIRLPSSLAFLASIASPTCHCSEHVFRRWFRFKKISSLYFWLSFRRRVENLISNERHVSHFFASPAKPSWASLWSCTARFCGRCLFSRVIRISRKIISGMNFACNWTNSHMMAYWSKTTVLFAGPQKHQCSIFLVIILCCLSFSYLLFLIVDKVNYLNWENVFSALGSSYKFTWSSISFSTFSNQLSKNYRKEASASSNLKWINNSELAGPIFSLFCPQIKFCAEFEEIENRIFCSHFSEQNLQKPVFFRAISLFRFKNHLFSDTYSMNPWETQVMKKFHKF